MVRFFFFFGVLLVHCLSIDAAIIYDNGAPDHMNGFEMTHEVQADDFTLTADTVIDGVKFWDFEIAGYFTGDISWEIYSNTTVDQGYPWEQGDQPGTLLASGTSANLTHTFTGFVLYGPVNEFVNTFHLAPIILPAGTYWLALHNGPLSNNVTQNVFWETTSQTGPRASRYLDPPFVPPWGTNFYPGTDFEFTFQMMGPPVPQISAFGLTNHAPTVTFITVIGENYRVEYKSNLVGPEEWTVLPGAEMIAGTGGMIAVDDTDPNITGMPRRFYRVVLL